MNAGLIYSVDNYVTVEKPLATANDVPFGISFISATLRQEGYGTELLILTPGSDINGLLSAFIARLKPKLFCLTSVSTQFPLIKLAAAEIKKIDPSIFVVLGGHHATLNPQEAIGAEGVDAICVGEGEAAARGLARAIESGVRPSGIPNLWIKTADGRVEKNQPDPFIENLDALPFIDRDIWEPWIHNPIESITVLVGRGCPYRCTYCSNHALAQVADGKYLRMRSPENVFDEVRVTLARWPKTRRIFFEVETFGAVPHYVFDFCAKLEEFNKTLPHPITFQTNMAVTDRLRGRSDVLEAMSKAGFDLVCIGFESGSERMRKEVLRRPKYANDTIIEFCETARKNGIDVLFYTLIGIPGETVEDFRETVRVARACQPRYCVLFICYPYPGTDMFDLAVKMGLVPVGGLNTSGERAVTVMDLPGFPRWRVRWEFIWFYLKVYGGKQPAMVVAGQTFKAAVLSMPRLHHFVKRFIFVTSFGRFLKKKLLVRED
jgi:radical SAM superfamily enzyme YgiQ (UPF0313 family)